MTSRSSTKTRHKSPQKSSKQLITNGGLGLPSAPTSSKDREDSATGASLTTVQILQAAKQHALNYPAATPSMPGSNPRSVTSSDSPDSDPDSDTGSGVDDPDDMDRRGSDDSDTAQLEVEEEGEEGQEEGEQEESDEDPEEEWVLLFFIM